MRLHRPVNWSHHLYWAEVVWEFPSFSEENTCHLPSLLVYCSLEKSLVNLSSNGTAHNFWWKTSHQNNMIEFEHRWEKPHDKIAHLFTTSCGFITFLIQTWRYWGCKGLWCTAYQVQCNVSFGNPRATLLTYHQIRQGCWHAGFIWKIVYIVIISTTLIKTRLDNSFCYHVTGPHFSDSQNW